ncbi:MAG TPA: DUF433 domain-containing protein [Thermoanaerobaculia bacterium]|nr:DUF433 domain-containing protein [Thermoanaerobaculia bacterium]
MSLAGAKSEPIPIVADADGVLRVEGTRVPLATVVEAFREGATPEEIVLRYPSLDLAGVYSVIGYVLHHRAEVDAYLDKQRRQSEAVRAENEARFDPTAVQERLIKWRRQAG